MDITDVRTVIGLCERSGVASIAIEGYEWLMHKGELADEEYKRLMKLYESDGDTFNLRRVKARYNKIHAQ